ncbi:MAG: T9SS type A sorting domain-containing protein [Bacteroidetes bacterium]|nr:T9SS type A sorting domain-containing protein [Bacteroidota bacterium]
MIKILKNSLLIPLAFLFSNTTLAQYSLKPSATFIHNTFYDALDYDGIIIKNESSADLNLEWEFISMDTISGCNFDMCASSECYIGIPAFGSFPAIAAGDTGFLFMHFWAGNVIGTSTAKVYIYEPSNPDNGDTLTFVLNVTGPNSIKKHDKEPPFYFYPNPATDFINIDTPLNQKYSVSVFNALGQRIIHKPAQTGNSLISIEHLEQGYYFLAFEDENNNIYTQKLIKSSRKN